MSRGPILLQSEVARAAVLRRKPQWASRPLSWRAIGKLLGRDHAGLRRAVKRLENRSGTT